MSFEINSFSSGLMLGITLYRNQPGSASKAVAQVGYALTALASVVETTVALPFATLSLLAYPFSSIPFEYTSKWIASSAFSFGWSVVDLFLNPFMYNLVADEKSALHILQSGDLTMLPFGALLRLRAAN